MIKKNTWKDIVGGIKQMKICISYDNILRGNAVWWYEKIENDMPRYDLACNHGGMQGNHMTSFDEEGEVGGGISFAQTWSAYLLLQLLTVSRLRGTMARMKMLNKCQDTFNLYEGWLCNEDEGEELLHPWSQSIQIWF